MYGSVFPYKRIRVDGSVSICGLFFTGKSAREAGIENNIGVNTAESTGEILPTKVQSDTMRMITGMKDAALKTLGGMGEVDHVKETIQRMFQIVASGEAKISTLESDKKKLESEAAIVPSMLSKLMNQCDSDTKDYRVRIKQLESVLDDLKLELTDFKEKEISWGLEKENLTSRQAIAPEAPAAPKQNGCRRPQHSPRRQPHSPSGSPPVQARQRPASTLGWIQRGVSSCALNNCAVRASGKNTLPRVASAGSATTSATPTVNRITKSFTSTADIRQQFDTLDTNNNGYLSREAVRLFYTAIDDYGVKKSEAEVFFIYFFLFYILKNLSILLKKLLSITKPIHR